MIHHWLALGLLAAQGGITPPDPEPPATGGGSYQAAQAQYESREQARKAYKKLLEAEDAPAVTTTRERAQDAPVAARTPPPAPIAPAPVDALPAFADAAEWGVLQAQLAAQAAEAVRQAALEAEFSDVMAILIGMEAL